MYSDPDLVAAVAGELALLDFEVRTSPERAEALLHPGFREFGSSGRVWEREEILAMMRAETEPVEIAADGIEAERLAADLVLVTYTSTSPARRALRSSLWRRHAGAWCLYFHQGTPIP